MTSMWFITQSVDLVGLRETFTNERSGAKRAGHRLKFAQKNIDEYCFSAVFGNQLAK